MQHCAVLLQLAPILVLPMKAESAVSRDIATVRTRYVNSLLDRAPDAAEVRALARALQEDGSWKEIDTHSTEPASWPTAGHLQRVLRMAQAYRTPGHPLAGDPALLQATLRAFRYWVDHDFRSTNWWYNEISVPGTVGQILLLLGPEVGAAERDRAIAVIMSRARIAMTGQNRVWLSQNVFLRGLLTGDEALV